MISFIVFDVETTGLRPGLDQIIELAMYKYIEGQLVDSWHSYFNPQQSISPRIQDLTGITEEIVAGAPIIWEREQDIINFIGDLPLVAHNLNFDISFLQQSLPCLDLSSKKCWDTALLGSILWPTMASHSLGFLCEKVGITLVDWHRASEDALATGELMLKISLGFNEMTLENLAYFLALAERFNPNLHSYFDQILKLKTKNFPDESINKEGPQLKSLGPLFQVTSPVSEKFIPEEGFIEKIFSSGGILSQSLEAYRHRVQQEDLALGIYEAFEKEKFLLAEAGTGTGKSLAYLVPSIYWALTSNKKVVIATHTINLQQQLWSKDIPLLKEVLPEFRAVLLKGKSNYLCRRRWISFLSLSENWGKEDLTFSLKLLVWLQVTSRGDREEVNLKGKERDFWNQVGGESESCLGYNCVHHHECFFFRARKEAEEAQIIIVNHSLLLADMRTDNKVLPSHQFLVLDEAHHLESVAANHLGENLNNFGILRFLKHLYNPAPEKGFIGFLKGAAFRLNLWQDIMSPEDFDGFKGFLSEAIGQVQASIEGVSELFNLLNGEFYQRQILEEGGLATLRIKPHHHSLEIWQYISSAAHNLHWRISGLKGALIKIYRLFEEYQEKNNYLSADILKDIEGFSQKIDGNMEFLKDFFGPQEEGHVYWIEWDKKDYGTLCNLRIAPIEVNELLKEGIFASKKSVIMTSATLTVQDSFHHFKARSGLDLLSSDKIIEKVVLSPFDYDGQSLLGICGTGLQDERGELNREKMAQVLVEATLASRGRTLILFTSHSLLREVYYLMKEPLEARGIFPLGHGIDGSRAAIVDLFKSNPNKHVILGANSFWEGVDLPGDNLVNLIITKLPFDAPNIPAIEARLEALQAKDINSFRYYSLPQAIIRFKQGVGRLIRSEKDFGVITILDPRLVEKNYGKAFLKSLPHRFHLRWTSDALSSQISRWINEKDLERLV